MRLLKNDNICEIIDVSQETKVKFYESIDKGSYIPNHWHRAVEIIYLLEGELAVSIEGKALSMKPGQCVLINVNDVHSTRCSRGNKALVLQIPIELIKIYLPNIEQYIFLMDDMENGRKERSENINTLKKYLSAMQEIDTEKAETFRLKFNILLLKLVLHLYENFSVKLFTADFKQKNSSLDRLNRVLNYISANYKRNIPLEEIANVAIFQPKSFCRFFKKYMGITFLEYQNELRLSYVYHDLIETEEPLNKILEEHGFTNYKLFRRMFKKYFDSTPMKIRKLAKNKIK